MHTHSKWTHHPLSYLEVVSGRKRNQQRGTQTIGDRVKRRDDFTFAVAIYHCKSIVCMLIIDKSHLDEKGHGLWSRVRWLKLVSLLPCDTVIDAAVNLTGLSWGVNKTARAKCRTRLVHSRCSVKGRFRQWDPVAKWHWFWILKLQLNFQEHFSSEYRGHNYKTFSKKILKKELN